MFKVSFFLSFTSGRLCSEYHERQLANCLENGCKNGAEHNATYQNKYGFSRSMLMPLTGSRRNQQWNVQPFWYGQRASGGNAIAYVTHTHTHSICYIVAETHGWPGWLIQSLPAPINEISQCY